MPGQSNTWVTGYGLYPMLNTCSLVEVTQEEVENSVKSIPKLDTLILVKVCIYYYKTCIPIHNDKLIQ